MFLPVEAFIGWRYTRARRRTRFVSLISAISIGGVALGIAALITILSIMNGFEREMRDRLLGLAAHIVVDRPQGTVDAEGALPAALAAREGVTGIAPQIAGDALLTFRGEVQGVRVYGVRPEAEAAVSAAPSLTREGDFAALAPGSFSIVLGRGLADVLRARVGDDITLVLPEPMRTAAGILPRVKRFTVAGIFEAGVQDYDMATAYVHLEDAARVFRVAGGVSGWRLRLADPLLAPSVGAALSRELAQAAGVGALRVTDWTETNANLFRALKTEKMVMFVILLASVAVAAFNLVSTLVMVVAEKHTEIAVLATLGLSRPRIVRVFFTQGVLIGVAGVALGAVGGVLLALNVESLVAFLERTFGFHILSPDVYYISKIPSVLETGDLLLALGVASLLCLVAPLYPAWQASLTQPAEALRYE
jgi:lipoprotein-releasing system permease protein